MPLGCSQVLSFEGIFEQIDSEWDYYVRLFAHLLVYLFQKQEENVVFYEGTTHQEQFQDNLCISWLEDSQSICFQLMH